MADNVYLLPETCGPLLREYYSRLLKEPIPQQLKDLLAMLEEASATSEANAPADADMRNHAAAREPQPGKSK